MNQQETYLEQLVVSLRTRLLVMGASVEIAVDNMRKAVWEVNAAHAQAVIENDDDIDDLENEIDESSLALLATAQPVARDLRFVVSCLRMVTDMERIGDEACAICSQVNLMDEKDRDVTREILGEHLADACGAFAEAMRIVRENDAEAAVKMSANVDDDALQGEVTTLGRLMERVSCKGGERLDSLLVMHLILIIHSLTRIWQRAANMVAHVSFACIGDSMKHVRAREKGKARA